VVLLGAPCLAPGFVRDSIAVMTITASLSAGIVPAFGHTPIWWGVIMIIVVEIGSSRRPSASTSSC
jgi:TRAP-type C4-dicarboxylate transport system permease large subunit